MLLHGFVKLENKQNIGFEFIFKMAYQNEFIICSKSKTRIEERTKINVKNNCLNCFRLFPFCLEMIQFLFTPFIKCIKLYVFVYKLFQIDKRTKNIKELFEKNIATLNRMLYEAFGRSTLK